MAPPPVLIGRIRSELDRCVVLAVELQSLFGSVLSAKRTPQQMVQAQSIDLLEQTLRDVCAVLDAVHSTEDLDSPETLVEACKLDDVARRLAGRHVVEAADQVEFF